MLEAYKIIARTEGICSALEPMAAAAEVILRQAKDKPKDYTICLSLCGRGEKDLDTIQEHIVKILSERFKKYLKIIIQKQN